MNKSVSMAPGPQAARSMLPDEAVAGAAKNVAPARVSGVGPAQGSFLEVGNGDARQALHADAEAQSHSQDAAQNAGAVGAGLKAGEAVRTMVEPGQAGQREADAAQVERQQTGAGWFGKLKDIVRAAHEFAERSWDMDTPSDDDEILSGPPDESPPRAPPNSAAAGGSPAVVLPPHGSPVAASAPHDPMASGAPPAQARGGAGRMWDGVSNIFGMANPRASMVEEPAPAAPPKTAKQRNLDRIAELESQVHQALSEVNQRVKDQTGKGIEGIEERLLLKGDLSEAERRPENMSSKVRHGVSGVIAAAVPVAFGLGKAAAAPIIAGAVAPLLGFPVLGAVVGYAVGIVTAIKALQGLDKKVMDEITKSRVAEVEKKLQAVHEELQSLEKEERARAGVEDLIRLAAKPRSQQIKALSTELSHIDKALQADKPANPEVVNKEVAPRKHPVTVSDGAMHREVLDASAETPGFFRRMFTRVVDFFFARRNAAGEERAYLNANHNKVAFQALSAQAPDSLINELEEQAEKRLVPGQQDMQGMGLRRELVPGENLVRALQAANEPNFGVADFGNRAIPATLSTARMMAWYLDALADLPRGPPDRYPGVPRVVRDGDSLIVPDPGRKLSNFLMGVPTAYAVMTPGQEGIRIDDHSPRMPGGMSGLQFRTELRDGSPVLKLSLVPKSSKQMFQKTDHYKQLVQLGVALRVANGAAGESPEKIAPSSPQQLHERRGRVEGELQALMVLEEQDMAQLEALSNWQDPERLAERTRLAPH